MKNLFFTLAILLMAAISLRAQDTEPQTLQFRFIEDGDTVYHPFMPPQQTKFHLGWQWAGHTYAINEYFRINAPHGGYYPDINDSSLIIQRGAGSGPGNEYGAFNSMAMQFDPAITVNLSSSFSPGSDTTGAVFGFKNKRGRRGDSTDYNRWIVDDSIPAGTAVLDSAALDDQLHFIGNMEDPPGNDYNGRRMYLALNLRLISSLALPIDTLLTIELPYTTLGGRNSSIVLDSIFTVNSDSIVTARGVVDNRSSLKGFSSGANKTKFAITKNMLPTDGSNITISANFRCGIPLIPINPSLFIINDTSTIQHLGIQVTTHAKGTVAIDWMRLETPNAGKLFRGGFDSLIQAQNQVIFSQMDTVTRGIKIFRFYGIDEINEARWKAARYHSRLMNHGVTQEAGYGHPKLYEHMVNPLDYWTGAGYSPDWLTAAPFLQNGIGNNDPRSLGLNFGYLRHDTATRMLHPITYDTLSVVVASQQEIFNGMYETAILEKSPHMHPWFDYNILLPLKASDRENLRTYVTTPDHLGNTDSTWVDNFYTKKLLSHWDSFLQGYEGYLYGFLKPETSADDMLYSAKPWWVQVWQTGEYVRISSSVYGSGYNNEAVTSGNKRNETGEEIRLMSWGPIILGAKGLTYDRAYSFRVNLNDFGVVGFTNGKSNNESDWGGDFLNERDDTINAVNPKYNFERHFGSYLWPYINRDTVAKYQGVDTNRIYLGRKSNRLVTKGIHEWLRHNESELMRLRLVGWYAKGFATFVNGDSASLAARLQLPYLSFTLPSPYSLTRPSWRSTVEPWDSAFVDYTILHDTTRGIDTVWMLGVQNRRTSPLILSPNWGSNSSDTAKFVTTDEFNTIANSDPSKRYKQGGAREITIPFNSVITDSATRNWVVYHVEELHDGTTPPAGIKRIDTTIHQGTNLAVNFLPGEGKMFRVTVIYPDLNPASGNLSHSNQRKLIAYPFVNAAGQMVRDTVRYHMTYHKARSPKPKYGAVDYGVYYKRSVPVPRQYPADMVRWEPQEYCLSDSIQTRLNIDTLDCAYPSLVVRTGSDSIARVYIVYGCRDKDVVVSAQDSFVVAEHVFPANSPVITSVGTGHIIARVNAKNYRDWVTPMINASRNGNYYTWSDSLRGIGLGFKTAGSTYLSDTSYISWEKSEGRTLGIAQHPSLNSYSRITLNEDDCALVWEERSVAAPPGTYMNRIYYTRLRMNADTILPYLPRGGFFVPERRVDTNSVCTIANLSDRTMGASQQSFPVIYRGVEDYETPCNSDLHIGHSDKVVWQGRHDITTNQKRSITCDDNISSVPTVLFYRTVDHRDSIGGGVYLPRDWAVMPTEKIWSGIYNLTQPTISQGGGVQIPSNHTNFSDSAILINYRATGICDSLTGLGDIWNLPMGFWTIFNKQGPLGTMTNANRIVFDGQYPQLAALPGINNINNSLEWRRNRRVFEKTIEANPTILSSSQYFLRSATGQASYAFSGFAKDSVRYLITPPLIGSSYYPLNPLKESISHLVPCQGIFHGRGDYIDTISTDWVPILNGTPITYYTLGSDTAAVSLLLDRYSTNTTAILPKPVATDTAAMDATYVIAPGQTDSYRIRLIRKNTNREYLEETVLSELPLVDLLGARGRAEQAYQDAKERGRSTTVIKGNLTCSLSPNPARDIIRVNIGGTIKREPVRLVISNLLGETVRVVETTTSEDTEISLVGLPSGQYMLRSALTKSEFFNPMVVPFVIER